MKDKTTNCIAFEEQLFALAENQLDDLSRRNTELHLAHCAACKLEFDEIKTFLGVVAKVETPQVSKEIRSNFYAMLGTFKEEKLNSTSTILNGIWLKVKDFFAYKPAFQMAFGIFLLSFGSMIGYFLGKPEDKSIVSTERIETLSTEVQEMKQIMMLQMLENPTATERMKAVSYTEELSCVDDKVVDALLTTLNQDESVNVRLVTLEALSELADNQKVREGLVQSLLKQESPLIQAALADLMVKLQEKRSLKPLREMLEKEKLNDAVKSKLQQSIKSLT